MGGLFAALASLATLILWAMGSGRRLALVKRRIARDWRALLQEMETRKSLLFQLGGTVEETVWCHLLAAHEELNSAVEEVEKGGGPLKKRLKAVKEAEQKLQTALARANEADDLDELVKVKDRLAFAQETYNDGVRLLRRLKKALFHWPVALFVCPRRVDLFETPLSADTGVVKINFEG